MTTMLRNMCTYFKISDNVRKLSGTKINSYAFYTARLVMNKY